MTAVWESVRWHEWDALRCVAGDAEMIVGVSAGPRILSLRWRGGPNLLHRDTTNFGVGNWRMFGGHRLSVAPEGVKSYLEDNTPCLVRIDGSQLQVGRVFGADRSCRALSISPAMDGFDVIHSVENCGPEPWSGAVWAITCIEPNGCIVSPCVESESLRFFDSQPAASFRSQWSWSEGCVVTAPGGARGKSGWHSEFGWLALLRPDVTFVIHSPDETPRESCVDGGCNVEVFVSRDYLEMETLGAIVILRPRERASHFQRWRLLPGGLTPAQWPAIGTFAGCRETAVTRLHAA